MVEENKPLTKTFSLNKIHGGENSSVNIKTTLTIKDHTTTNNVKKQC
jgi:hypothetical protein